MPCDDAAMWLPVPSASGVESFKALVLAEFGVELNDEDAREVATRVLQIQVMKLYENGNLREEIQRVRRQAGSVNRRSDRRSSINGQTGGDQS